MGLVPDVSGSPQHETKIRQISQGVEDITWQNMAKEPSPAPEKRDDQQEAMDTEHEQKEVRDELIQPPPVLRGENPPQVLDNDGEEEHAGEADPAEVPPSVQPEDPISVDGNASSTPPEAVVEPIPKSTVQPPSSLSRRGSDESMDQEKGLKRKLADRSVSDRKFPEDVLAEMDAAKSSTSAKRPRDDPDADENPRETKRPTPPPDEEKEADSPLPSTASTSLAPSEAQSKVSTPKLSQEPLPSVSTPKLVCIGHCTIMPYLSNIEIEWLYGICFDELSLRVGQRTEFVLH